MAWTVPKTWTAGVVTAAEMNSEVRDNLTFIKDALTTHGITSDSVVQALLGARYGCSATITGYAIGDADDRTIQFSDSDLEWDDDTFHNDANKGRFTAPVTGTYECKAFIDFDPDGDGRREVWIEKNTTTEYNRVRVTSTGSSAATGLFTSVELEMNAGDYVIMMCRHTAGSTLDVDARFQIRRIAA